MMHSALPKSLEGFYADEDNTAITAYESALKNYFGATYCLALSSGTASLLAALVAVGSTRGCQVVAPPTAPLCTAYPILSTGSTLAFGDIRPGNFGLDVNGLFRIAGNDTRAIVEVPMWGYATPAEALRDFAADRDIPLIFDLAHCAGTTLHGRPLSDYCDIACFSTQKHKIFSTGEGGFLLTNNEAYYQRALMYTRMGELNGRDFGLNFKISSAQAQAGIAALETISHNLRTRRNNSTRITSGITNPAVAEVEVIAGSEPSYQRLLLQSKKASRALAAHLVSRGIPSDMHKYGIKPLYDYPILQQLKTPCPNAEQMLSVTSTVPVHHAYREQDLAYIIDAINSFKE